jgi:signal transduction histidine kinase
MTESVLAELQRYIGWSDGDTSRLRGLEPVLRPRFAGFAEHFYDVISRHLRAIAVFSGGEAQVARLKAMLVDWMASGLVGPHDEAFYARRSRIGERHVSIGLPQEYMFASMSVLRLDYHAAIAELVPATEATATIGSVDKLFDLELAIMLRHYQLASEAKLVDRERTAQHAKLAAMQTLSAGLAHELRNPLNAAKLQLDVLERRLGRVADDDRLRETVAQIEHEMHRLARLLNGFLAFAQPAPLVTAPQDLVPIVRDTVDAETPHAASGGVTLTLVASERAMARVDGPYVVKIVQALVRNAIEATPAGGEVTIEVGVVDQRPQVRVTDRGNGIPPVVRDRIFEPFFSTKPDGTGLGLAIVHSLVSAHTGSVEVDSELGRGTTFTVTLPPA